MGSLVKKKDNKKPQRAATHKSELTGANTRGVRDMSRGAKNLRIGLIERYLKPMPGPGPPTTPETATGLSRMEPMPQPSPEMRLSPELNTTPCHRSTGDQLKDNWAKGTSSRSPDDQLMDW